MTVTKKTVRIAKGGKKPTTRKPVTRKSVTRKKSTKKLSATELRDQKAKQKVVELLKDSALSIQKEEVLTPKNEQPIGKEWLQEQVSLLSKEVESLKKELTLTKTENDDSELKKAIIAIFNELQTNYQKMGRDPNTNKINLIIPPIAFMNRLIMFFPFLGEMKKF